MKNYITLLFLVPFLYFSCDKIGYKTTPSGLEYRILTSTKNNHRRARKPKNGEFLKVNVTRLSGSLVSYQTPTGTYEYIPYQKQENKSEKYNFFEIFDVLSEGDSVTMRIPMDSLIDGQPMGSVKNYIPGKYITFYLKFAKIVSKEQKEAEEKEQNSTRIAQQTNEIKAYISKKNYKVISKNGVFIQKEKIGKGDSIQIRDTVFVRYSGFLFNGKNFDSNFKEGRGLFELIIGTGQVIQGFEIPLIGAQVGDKINVIIPSPLGYGTNGAGEAIPPNTPLHFYIEVIQVKKAKT